MAFPHPKGLSTRLLLLMELHNRRHAKLRPLADQLGISVQAVSVVLKRLSVEGLVEHRADAWRPTQRGTDSVHQAVRDLRRFVDDALGNLRLIEETVAQADAPVRTGQEIGLYMKDGRLRAAPKVYAGSHGRARAAARRGDLVRIGDLRGIVALRPAPFTVVAHPDALSPAQKRRALALTGASRNGDGPLRFGAHDLTSAVILEQLGHRPDFEFAPLSAALEAAHRGVPVQYWVPLRDLPDCLSTVSQSNAAAPQPLRVRSVEL